MKLLILGGTQFVGLHITEAALAAGHEVTLFNRGKTKSDLFPQVEKLTGNRDPNIDEGLTALAGRQWDAVIDVNGYIPRIVRASAELLKDSLKHYVFISTLSVYDDPETLYHDEDAPLLPMPENESLEEYKGHTYGPLKVLCEEVVQEIYADHALILRPGFVVGPHDHTDRFTYWVRRVAQGGEMLCAGKPDDPVQFVDARDLAAFTIALTAQQRTGVYNVTGPAAPLTWGQVFDQTKALRGSDTTFTWVDHDFLHTHDAKQQEIPMILPPEYEGVMRFSNERAKQAGLTFRPLKDTITDLLAWDAEHGKPHAGFTRERETELLKAWHAR
jgi:2'-hydroxyisoflavone reductase